MCTLTIATYSRKQPPWCITHTHVQFTEAVPCTQFWMVILYFQPYLSSSELQTSVDFQESSNSRPFQLLWHPRGVAGPQPVSQVYPPCTCATIQHVTGEQANNTQYVDLRMHEVDL